MRPRIRLIWELGISLLCLHVPGVWAAGDTTTQPAGAGLSSLKTILALVIVLALILGAAWAARRFLPFLPQRPQKNDQIQLLSMRALGPRKSIHLLQVDGHRLLIGSTDTNIRLLKELESPPSGDRS